ncbi:MAG: DUF2784 domain-containing protein [Magnetococcales bacterium]|nr:DUF2784 domain-containing protein [Magnetococcales bacterium]
MIYRLMADGVVSVHILFVLFVLFGGLLLTRWPGLVWVHVPSAIWGAAIEFGGWICPLTHLENHLRRLSHQEGYTTSFVEHYLLPVIYPDLWFPTGFPAWGFTLIGCGVILLNGVIYRRLWRRRRALSPRGGA